MKLSELKNKKILIVGKGIEGNAVFKYLKKNLSNSAIDIVDKKEGENYLDKQKNYDIAIKSPGVKSDLIKIPYTTATNIFLSNAKGKVIGVTGTKGKSTTTSLIFEMLKKSFDSALDKRVYLGGNIGRSPLDFIEELKDNSWTVLEMSSFQLSDIKASPHIAVVLMITSEHLDYHGSFEKYLDAKRNILRFQNSNDFAILNRDYLPSHESDIHTQGKIFHISRERESINGCFVQENNIWFEKDGKKEKIIDIDRILLLGKHNLENVCAAVCASLIAGASKSNIVKVLSEFAGLEHRLEFVGEKNNILFYNDTLATIPEATIEALESLPNTETLVAGGHDRGLDYKELAQYLVKSQMKTLILFPETGIRIWDEIYKINPKTEIEKFDVKTMEQAVRIGASETTPGKICLLSPASASFGIFKDYKDRGDQFKREIKKIS